MKIAGTGPCVKGSDTRGSLERRIFPPGRGKSDKLLGRLVSQGVMDRYSKVYMGTKRGRPWALVLSGGGAKGLAHIGVIAALEELGFPKPSLVVGTSMGAIVGGLYAKGIPLGELLDFAGSFDIHRYLDSVALPLPGQALRRVVRTGIMIGNLAVKSGMDSGKGILDLLERMSGGTNVEGTEIPFRCNAVDLLSGEEYLWDQGPLALAMRSSMSVPGIFEPVPYRGMLLADGGLIDNMPVRVARELGFGRVLAVNVWNFRRITPEALKTGPMVLYRAFEVVTAARDMGSGMRATMSLSVDNGSSALDFDRSKALIDLGRSRVKENEAALASFFYGSGPIGVLRRMFGGRAPTRRQGSV